MSLNTETVTDALCDRSLSHHSVIESCYYVIFLVDRPESFDQKGLLGNQLEPGAFPIRKSQDAAVGALVRMLKKAPPLRQELSSSMADYSSQDSKSRLWTGTTQPEQQADSSSSSIMSSGLTASKTTADALEELHGYKRMKDFLLRQGG
ncbi:Autophagy-related protein 13b [Linum perenne]